MKKIRIIVVCIVLIFLSLFVVGCKNNNGIVKYGFEFKSIHEETSGIFVAYSLPSQIDKDEEIVVDLYFGHISGDMSQKVESDFDLIIYSLSDKDNSIEKKIIDFYNNEEYICLLSRDNKYSRRWKINYSHKETLVLPSELFCEDKDEVVFMVQGIYGFDDKRSGWISFCYSKSDVGNIEIKKGAHSNVNYI